MKLDKMILINWGPLRSQEYPMGNMTLFTGPTGAGKSTILDAIQAVMTATYANIFSFNPGQDEQSQNSRNGKSKRTLWSYIVGAEDNLFARPDGAHGYLAAVFKPSEGETGKSFTAVVAAAARVDGSGERRQAVQERLNLVIVNDAELEYDDFVEKRDESGTQMVAVENIAKTLARRYRGITNYHDSKREYLCALYGLFRGDRPVSFEQAELAAKAWTQSIAYKPIGSVDDLVRTQILEHDPQQLAQRISQISDLMRLVSGLRRDGERLKNNVARLEGLTSAINKAAKGFESKAVFSVSAAQAHVLDDDRLMSEHQSAIEGLLSGIAADNLAVQDMLVDKDGLARRQVSLQAALRGIPAADQQQRIEERLRTAHNQVADAILRLKAGTLAARSLWTASRTLAGLNMPSDRPGLVAALRSISDAVAATGDVPFDRLESHLAELGEAEYLTTREVLAVTEKFDGLAERFRTLHDAVAGADDGLVTKLRYQLAVFEPELAQASKLEKTLSQQKQSLASGGAAYPNEITAALNAFKAHLPGANVQVLCDLIEPAPGSDWQNAIEGYMGGSRFNFVVSPEWESRATNFLRTNNLRAKVIQGSMCLKHSRDRLVPADSIVHELRTEHPIAQAFLADQYGAVVKVDDAEALRATPRGVTKDGKAAGGRTTYAVNIRDIVFGKEAKRLKREQVALEHSEAEASLERLRDLQKGLNAAIALCMKVLVPNLSADVLLERAVRDADDAKAELALLDLTEVEKLTGEADALATQIRGIETRIRDVDRRVGGYQGQIAAHRVELTKLDANRPVKQSRVDAETSKLRELVAANAALSFTTLTEQISEILAENVLSPEQLRAKAQNFELESSKSFLKVNQEIAEYNTHAQGDERLEYLNDGEHIADALATTYIPMIQLRAQIREQLDRQKDIGVVKNLDQLRQAESSFKDVFTKQFCYEIRNAVDMGVNTLRLLNAELERLKFGTDKFRLDWSEWVPEFKDFYNFFKAAYDLSESQDAPDLFGTTELSPENCAIRDKLVALLLSDDHEHALKELQRIADYRNYRRYEIWKDSDTGSKVALSGWGTGSGGQLETPAYIIRAAVVTNRLKHFDKGSKLKLMMNDESFAKTDERRARDIIKFLRDKLGMQILCAMPTKHSGGLKTEFTKEWSFTRTVTSDNGEVDFYSEADERDLKPDPLRELWDHRREHVREQARIEFDRNSPAPNGEAA